MSSMPPYGNDNPYDPPSQYPASGQPPSGPYQAPIYQAPMYQTPVYAQPQYMVAMPVVDPKAGQALAGMILGIIGFILPFFGLLPLIGLIFSIIGLKSVTRKGMAIAGLVLSIIGLLFGLSFILCLIGAFTTSHYSTY